MTTILLAGVAVLDFVFQVDHFPRIADKFRAKDAMIVNGGNAANASIALAKMGARPLLAARLGDDPVADLILAGLEKHEVDTALTRRFPGNRSSYSSIYLDDTGERQIVNFRDNTLTMAPDWLEAAMPKDFSAVLGETRWPAGAKAAMQAARDRGVPGVMDGEVPVFEGEEALRLASHVAFSARAACEFSGEEDVEQAILKADTLLPGRVLATDGPRGTFEADNGSIRQHPAFAVDAVDTLGAGDVWHAAFTLRLGEGAKEADAIRFASAAAAIKCTRAGGGSGAPARAEIEQFLSERER